MVDDIRDCIGERYVKGEKIEVKRLSVRLYRQMERKEEREKGKTKESLISRDITGNKQEKRTKKGKKLQ